VVEDGARRTEDGVSTVEQARESFLQISESVQDMNGRVEQIAASAQELARHAEELDRIVGRFTLASASSPATSRRRSIVGVWCRSAQPGAAAVDHPGRRGASRRP